MGSHKMPTEGGKQTEEAERVESNAAVLLDLVIEAVWPPLFREEHN